MNLGTMDFFSAVLMGMGASAVLVSVAFVAARYIMRARLRRNIVQRILYDLEAKKRERE